MDNMYKEGGKRGDKGFVWTFKTPEEIAKEKRKREKRLQEQEEARSKLKFVSVYSNTEDEEPRKKDVAVGRDNPNVAVVHGEQRYLIDLGRQEEPPMPQLEEAVGGNE